MNINIKGPIYFFGIPCLVILMAISSTGCLIRPVQDKKNESDLFEIVCTTIDKWLHTINIDSTIVSANYLKEQIIDDWYEQNKKFQIVDVRRPAHYDTAGHISHAINIYWAEILNDTNIYKLDTNKTLILYCYYGHGSMIIYTILGLMGYNCNSLNFGMMEWNLNALVRDPWDQEASYLIENKANIATISYEFPKISTSQKVIKQIIRELSKKYLEGEASPVISTSEVNTIISDWNKNSFSYQIVDVRSSYDYNKGHVPHSVHVPWKYIVEKNNLIKLDPKKTIIIYSENGQIGQMVTTVLCLLGYQVVNMKFGMMDWNKTYVNTSDLWDGQAGYSVECDKVLNIK